MTIQTPNLSPSQPGSKRPIIIPRDDGMWELAVNYREVPKGFITDGASIPRFLWRVLGSPMEPQTCGAAIRHDYAYTRGELPRKEADDRFYGNLRAAGVGVPRAFCYWLGVRAFGWIFYNNKGDDRK